MTILTDLSADAESAQKTASVCTPCRPTRELLFFVTKSPLVPPRVQPKSQINGNIQFLIKFHSNLCPEHILTLLKRFRIDGWFFRVIWLFGCTLGGTRGDFVTKNKSSRVGLQGVQTDAVFCADSASALRSVKIVIHFRGMTTKSSKIDKKSSLFTAEPRTHKEGRLSKPRIGLAFVAFFKGYPVIFNRRWSKQVTIVSYQRQQWRYRILMTVLTKWPRFRRVGRLLEPRIKPGFVAFFKRFPMMFELRYLTVRAYLIFVPYIVSL